MTDTPQQPFGNVPNNSESFGTIRNPAENFRSFRNSAEPTENHTLTVREVARMFESAGVARTERSIINWCQPNRMGVARLDCFFDTNERKYFITPESVERAIKEEQARAARHNEPLPKLAEDISDVPNTSEPRPQYEQRSNDDSEELTELQKQLRDLEITNRVKDAYIDQLKGSLQSGDQERRSYIQQLIEKSAQIGSLETQLRQLSASRNRSDDGLPNPSERLETKSDAGEQT